jgi:hypothetical protein
MNTYEITLSGGAKMQIKADDLGILTDGSTAILKDNAGKIVALIPMASVVAIIKQPRTQ